jgi:oxygen-dependent protoporphyrinogen oxidase
VQDVQRRKDGWMVSAGHASDHFDAVVVATPAQAAAEFLSMVSENLASELQGIQYTSSVTVNLGYDASVRAALPPGFGFLIPRSEDKRMLAVTFVHNKFPHRAPDDRALLRCFIGGARNEQILQAPDEDVLRIVREELQQIIGLAAAPLFTRVYRWQAAMAQYGVGHLERLHRIESVLQQLPGLTLAGNGYRGIGVPDCVRSGTDAALLEVGLPEVISKVLTS